MLTYALELRFLSHLAMLLSVTQIFDDHLATLQSVDEFDEEAQPNGH